MLDASTDSAPTRATARARRRSISLLVARGSVLPLAALLSATGACRDAALRPSPLSVRASELRFDLPDNVPGGTVELTLENQGHLAHDAVILRIGDTPLDRVVGDLRATSYGLPLPSYLGFAGGVAAASPGSSRQTVQTLSPGRYAVVCSLSDAGTGGVGALLAGQRPGAGPQAHFSLGMAQAFRVTGARSGRLPGTDGTVTARDYTWRVGRLRPGPSVLGFRNHGPHEAHVAVVAEYPPGVDERAARPALQQQLLGLVDPQPFAGPEGARVVASSGPFGPGLGGTFPVTLEAGRTYVVYCVVADRDGSAPHVVTEAMFRFFRPG